VKKWKFRHYLALISIVILPLAGSFALYQKYSNYYLYEIEIYNPTSVDLALWYEVCPYEAYLLKDRPPKFLCGYAAKNYIPRKFSLLSKASIKLQFQRTPDAVILTFYDKEKGIIIDRKLKLGQDFFENRDLFYEFEH